MLNTGGLKDYFGAIGELIKQQSERKTKEADAQRAFAWKATLMGLGFSALVFILLCVLLWHDKITKELAAGLIGSLIGYWYGHQKDK